MIPLPPQPEEGEKTMQKVEQRMQLLADADLELWTGGMGLSVDLLGLGASPEQAVEWSKGLGKGGQWVEV